MSLDKNKLHVYHSPFHDHGKFRLQTHIRGNHHKKINQMTDHDQHCRFFSQNDTPDLAQDDPITPTLLPSLSSTLTTTRFSNPKPHATNKPSSDNTDRLGNSKLITYSRAVLLTAFLLLIIATLVTIKLVKRHQHESLLVDHGLSHYPTPGRFHIFLIWFEKSFPPMYMRAFETLLKHHPDAEIMIFSNELSLDTFNAYTNPYKKATPTPILSRMKDLLNVADEPWDSKLINTITSDRPPFNFEKAFNIHVVRYNLLEMARGKSTESFAGKVDLFLGGNSIPGKVLTQVHISDFLRYFLVYHFGGLYLDADMFIMRNLQSLHNTIGAYTNRSPVCHYETYSKGNIKNFACLNNGFLSFERGHPFLKEALNKYEYVWSKQQGYGPEGGAMLTGIIWKYLNNINLLDNNDLLCNGFSNNYARTNVSRSDTSMTYTVDNCYVLSVGQGKDTNRIEMKRHSFLERVYERVMNIDPDGIMEQAEYEKIGKVQELELQKQEAVENKESKQARSRLTIIMGKNEKKLENVIEEDQKEKQQVVTGIIQKMQNGVKKTSKKKLKKSNNGDYGTDNRPIQFKKKT